MLSAEPVLKSHPNTNELLLEHVSREFGIQQADLEHANLHFNNRTVVAAVAREQLSLKCRPGFSCKPNAATKLHSIIDLTESRAPSSQITQGILSWFWLYVMCCTCVLLGWCKLRNHSR